MIVFKVEATPKPPAKVPNEPRKNEARTKHKFDKVFHAIPFYGPLPPMSSIGPMVAYPPLNTLVKKKIEEVKEYELKGQSQNARQEMSHHPVACKSLNCLFTTNSANLVCIILEICCKGCLFLTM